MTDHTIQVRERGRLLGCLSGGGCVSRLRIYHEHWPTRNESEWLKFSQLVIKLRRDNPEYSFHPKASKPGQRMFT